MSASANPRREMFLLGVPDTECDPKVRASSWADLSAQALLDAAPDAMLVVNQAARIVGANVQAEKLFGYGREDLIGRSVESLIPFGRTEHPPHRENFWGDPPLRPTSIGFESFAVRKDATEVPVEISLLTSEAGTFIVGSIRDATDRRRTEGLKMLYAVLREIRESEKWFGLI